MGWYEHMDLSGCGLVSAWVWTCRCGCRLDMSMWVWAGVSVGVDCCEHLAMCLGVGW